MMSADLQSSPVVESNNETLCRFAIPTSRWHLSLWYMRFNASEDFSVKNKCLFLLPSDIDNHISRLPAFHCQYVFREEEVQHRHRFSGLPCDRFPTRLFIFVPECSVFISPAFLCPVLHIVCSSAYVMMDVTA